MKKLFIFTFIFSSIFLASCSKNEVSENITNSNSWQVLIETWTENITQTWIELKSQTWAENKTETWIIQDEKEYKIIDLTNKSKANLKCDESFENCNLSITFWDFWTFNVFNGYIDLDDMFFKNEFWWKAYFNEKYNTIFVSFWISRVGQNIITNSVKIDLKTKQTTKLEETLWNEFYFKDIDTIIPKSKNVSETSYEEVEEEWKAIILWESNNSKENNLSWIGFIKKYYEIMWKKDFNELAKMTDWNTFEQLQNMYKNLDKVELVDVKDLWNSKYKITVDLYEKIINTYWSAHWNKSITEYLDDEFLYSKIIIEKEIVNWKLKTIKWTNKTIALPRVKANYSWTDDWWSSYWKLIFEKKLVNWKIFKVEWSMQDWETITLYLFNWKNYISWDMYKSDFYWLIWWKTSDGIWWEQNDKSLLQNFQQATDDMIEKTLIQ